MARYAINQSVTQVEAPRLLKGEGRINLTLRRVTG